MDLVAGKSDENYKSTIAKASRWGCKELENTETTQHALETFKPEGALGGGGCGERQLEGGWWDHWTHKLTAAWLVCPKTGKGESWEEEVLLGGRQPSYHGDSSFGSGAPASGHCGTERHERGRLCPGWQGPAEGRGHPDAASQTQGQ